MRGRRNWETELVDSRAPDSQPQLRLAGFSKALSPALLTLYSRGNPDPKAGLEEVQATDGPQLYQLNFDQVLGPCSPSPSGFWY